MTVRQHCGLKYGSLHGFTPGHRSPCLRKAITARALLRTAAEDVPAAALRAQGQIRLR
jgi:hypothetical protein